MAMIAYFDMFSGTSGDMTLGALIDLGVPLAWLKEQLAAMPLSGFDISGGAVWCNGIKATDITVTEQENVPPKNYKDIKILLSDAPFSSRVIEQSLGAFKKIALAESAIHGSDLESVHFHEVGGIDALVDIVGSFLCAEYLGITRVHASPVPLARGFVTCSHGIIPVPAPATLGILKGIPVTTSDIGMENVTPTGAAIISTLAQSFGPMPDMVMGQVGYGAGKRKSDTGVPNLLRIVTGTSTFCEDTPFIKQETVWVVETTIDDMNPEVSGYIMDKLFEHGALDVCYIPVHMKKNRPGTRLEVLCHEKVLKELMNFILTQSSSTGVRFNKVRRGVLHREIVTVSTCFGRIKAKKIIDPTGTFRIVPEYDVCRRVAEKRNIPLRDVYTGILADVKDMDSHCDRKHDIADGHAHDHDHSHNNHEHTHPHSHDCEITHDKGHVHGNNRVREAEK